MTEDLLCRRLLSEVIGQKRSSNFDLKPASGELKARMKITLGTIVHIKQLAVSREDGGISDTDRVELFDSIDCLDADELSELYAIVKVGQCRAVEQYDAEVAKASGREAGAAEHIFGLRELGTFLVAGTADLHLG